MRLLPLPLLLNLGTSCREPGFLADADNDGFAESDGDCNDDDRAVHPEAPELCNGVDDDCSGVADDGAVDLRQWFVDSDGDGFGSGEPVTGCEAPEESALLGGDCDDGDATAFPGAPEDCSDGIDRNCDGAVGNIDQDNDGFPACGDCDDLNRFIFPGADERCNGIDDDCDEGIDEDGAIGERAWYADADGDGYGANQPPVILCEAPNGFVADASDCDDRNPVANPGQTEVCDGYDNDCDGSTDEGLRAIWYPDGDGDGQGVGALGVELCDAPGGSWVTDDGDCDDSDFTTHTGATPVCDGVDHDCDGDIDFDSDGDGWAADSCGGPDCDDDDDATFPDSNGVCALGRDCSDVLTAGRSTGDGLYTVDVDGRDTGLDPELVYCDMSTAGGGWTLVYAYTFAHYAFFTTAPNAVWPIPSWGASVTTSAVSTETPTDPSDYGAMEWSRWSTFGREFMVTSNINDHVRCTEGTGSLVDDVSGTVSCVNIANIAPACNGLAPTSYRSTTDVVRGPILSRTNAYYYWDGDSTANYPTHDPCGQNQANQLTGVSGPEGQIWVRF